VEAQPGTDPVLGAAGPVGGDEPLPFHVGQNSHQLVEDTTQQSRPLIGGPRQLVQGFGIRILPGDRDVVIDPGARAAVGTVVRATMTRAIVT
jgi:hypothetical protein